MSWVLITKHHGPGRQSHTEEYVYFRRASKKAIKEYIDEMDMSMHNGFDGPVIVDWKKVASLPVSEHHDLIQHHTWRVDHSRAMLDILAKTKVHPEYEWKCIACGYTTRRKSLKCPRDTESCRKNPAFKDCGKQNLKRIKRVFSWEKNNDHQIK